MWQCLCPSGSDVEWEDREIQVNKEEQHNDDKPDPNCTTYLIKTSANSSITEICDDDELSKIPSTNMPNLETISTSSNFSGRHLANFNAPLLANGGYIVKPYIDNVIMQDKMDLISSWLADELIDEFPKEPDCIKPVEDSLRSSARRSATLVNGFQLRPGRDPTGEPYTDYIFLHTRLTVASETQTPPTPVFTQQTLKLLTPWLQPYPGAPISIPKPESPLDISMLSIYPPMRGHYTRNSKTVNRISEPISRPIPGVPFITRAPLNNGDIPVDTTMMAWSSTSSIWFSARLASLPTPCAHHSNNSVIMQQISSNWVV
ncbi:hypothetical protein FIBSPDRAFT_884660 [Athelia psychrophila]|uniref:Uncharacterized protein n=1 Tax=Athelia psychrophila TaxID=1759441 RepID=A0A166SZJ5_9AGAM|nr:hypothetical protein FIBSPDRAFT_884660 [Fibularhizoctonia sp. CBS 109695]